ncbi:thymidine phosphorylase [Endozoicomonas sp. G2_1]|uniref:thymidine phosphorylase n=1 Tax=Endozoicomonas sp. G2_1 TaxID=2821091 RepID=UPI001ADA3228|nr:thymidine phosphorylase [Endozoicomonas sp. G2_1]MBO9492264.1 thymidine phosphorylase [Endozoicomonas sp. G2_1]
MFLPQEIIRAKRNGEQLSSEQIQTFVDGLVSGYFNDAQVGAMAMAIFQQGMKVEETVALTKAMMNSGETLTWRGQDQFNVDGPVVDKHSTGGVGDKVSFMLAAIVGACGAYVPMISGRGLGHTGGTADKLESIAGFNVQPSIEHFKEIVAKQQMAIISQTANLAPADKRLYGIRDVTATVESIPLITASILSKKLAAGLDALVMDVKVGNGAMMNSLTDATALAQSIVDVANGAGVKTQAIITDMNQVLGNTAGNALEMVETALYLRGDYLEPRLHQVVVSLAKAMLINTGLASSEQDAEQQINNVLSSGKAAEQFDQMIFALGGPKNFVETPWQSMQTANVVKDIVAPRTGFISAMQTFDIGMSVVELGGGRVANDQAVDHTVGFDQIVPVGTEINSGDVVARVHARTEDEANRATEQYLTALSFDEQKPEQDPVIYKTIG